MAGVSGGKLRWEARPGTLRRARSSTKARPTRRASRDIFIVSVRESEFAGSGLRRTSLSCSRRVRNDFCGNNLEQEARGALFILVEPVTAGHITEPSLLERGL